MTARILVVHDQKALRERIENILSPFHAVTVCGDIPDAIDTIKALEQVRLSGTLLDLIISAVHVNGDSNLSVFDLLKWSKGNPHVAGVPFVLLDTEPSPLARYLTDSVREAGHALGAAGYKVIHKFDAQEFLTDLEAYLPPELRSTCQTDQNQSAA